MKKIVLSLLVASLLVACGTTTTTPQPTPTQTLEIKSIPTLYSTGCSNDECAPLQTPAPLDPLRFTLPTPGVDPISAWRPPLYPVPWALGAFDHFYFVRPIEADQVNWPLASYRYGGSFFGDDVVHTGVDIDAPAGTPIHAAGSGKIIWAGYGFFSGVRGNEDDPYGLAVVIQHDFGYQNKALFTIYAHMDSVNVIEEQWVQTGDVLGKVGDTGFTTGPHLHFEVRLGANSYYSTRNPELWIAPPQGWGVLAGRIMQKDLSTIPGISFTVKSLETDQRWKVSTYGGKIIISDDYYKENFVLSDLPAGRYQFELILTENSKPLIQFFEIKPGQVTYITYREEHGFSIDNLPAPNYQPSTPVPSPTP